MHRHRCICLAAVAALAIAARGAGAQALSTEEAAHSGIVLTPIGALPEVVRVYLPEDSASRVQAQLRYGIWKSDAGTLQFQNFGVTALYRVKPRLALGGTLGYRGCGNCDGLRMVSADAEVPLFHQTNEHRGEGFIDVALQASAGLGVADTTRVSARSLGAWLPISVSLPESGDALVTISFAPGLALGYVTDKTGDVLGYVGSDGGARAMLNASFAYVTGGPFGLHASFQRVMVSDSPTHFGFGASWRFGAGRR